jgi:hypothetical protein
MEEQWQISEEEGGTVAKRLEEQWQSSEEEGGTVAEHRKD